MEKTKIYKALKGVRGKKPCDLELLDQVFVRFSELIVDQPWIKELDINPMLATPTDIIALDARVVLHAPGTPVEKLSKPSTRGYPHQYKSTFTMKNGVACEVRPIRPDDETAMKSFEEGLSEAAVKAYMSEAVPLEDRVSHKRLAPLCHPDFDRQIPLIALVDGKIVATAHMCKLPLTYNARLMVEVDDAFQKQGLGKYLMEQCVAMAKAEGVQKLGMKYFEDNAAMMKLATEFGFEAAAKDGVVCATKVF